MPKGECRKELEREAPVLANTDVVVVGGGFPGVCAAVAAGRAGAKVALIERDGMLGGQAAEIYTFGLDGFIDNIGKQFVKGIPWEIIQRTLGEGQSDPVWEELFRQYVPGFEKAHLMDVHPHIARALHISREPGGFTEHDIPWEHIGKDGEVYADSIARVMGHPDAGQAPSGFQVPYRSLIPKGLEGLLVIGKPACRFFHYHGTNAALGQAVGVAAAIVAKEGVPLRALSVPRVQKELQRQGAVVF